MIIKLRKKPTLDGPADLAGTPVRMSVTATEPYERAGFRWHVSILTTLPYYPEWAKDHLRHHAFFATGTQRSLEKAQEAALKAARLLFIKYRKTLVQLSNRLSKEMAKDLAKMAKIK